MTGIDYYKSVEMDASIIINFPKGMPGVLSALTELLNARGKMVVLDAITTIDDARRVTQEATGQTDIYYCVLSSDAALWSVLRGPVNADKLRVLGVFHGPVPETVPENVVTIDLGQGLHKKVAKAVVSDIVSALARPGKFPVSSVEETYEAFLTLCFEVLYSPEYRFFPKKVAESIPVARAFSFMYNPPEPLSPATMKSATIQLVEDLHGYMG